MLSSASVTLGLCLMLSWIRPPSPEVHDEFSYLLAADTFAHGRLTNPTHPLWQHFETFHVLQQPTYQSKYPPGQGLFLAAGEVLTGRPIVGVWLSMAAAAAALCWMLLAWMPPRWALFGGLLPVIRFGMLPLHNTAHFAYWSTTFWGGGAALFGGALLFGALGRMVRQPRARHAVILAAGLVVLANTRPFEGLLAALGAAAVLLGWMLTRRPPARTLARQLVAPVIAVLSLGALGMGYYNFRVTGDPLLPPYLVYSNTYDIAPLIVLYPLKPDKTYRHQALRDFQHGFMLDNYKRKRNFSLSSADLIRPALFFWGYALLIPLLWLLAWPWNRWVVFGAAMVALSTLANKITITSQLHYHYLAPVAPWFVFAAVAGLRRLRVWRAGTRRIGLPMAESIVAICLFSFVGSCALWWNYRPAYRYTLGHYRLDIAQRLEALGGKHLVIVTYGPDHSYQLEWVHNAADPDKAKIVWARDMGAAKNKRLLEYYAGRKIWRLYADRRPPELEALAPE